MFKKPEDENLSLDNELYIDPDSQQPIIPRHARDQLMRADEAEVPVPEVTASDSVEQAPVKKRPTNSLVELQQAILEKEQEAAMQEQMLVQVAQEKASVSQQNGTQKDSIQQVSPEVKETSVATIVEPLTQIVDKESIDVAQATQNTITSTDHLPEHVKATDLKVNKDLNVSEIEDFDGESSILDLHLTEQQRFDDESALANAESIIALNVYPNIRFALSGDKTLKILLKYGLRYGEMACFHRYENTDEPSQLMFSVLRITDEGHAGFDLETLSTEQVHGLAFFLALPHNDVQKGYDTMVSIAGLIAREIDGTVYDENNLEFTPQLKEHWRHQAIDYRSTQEA